MTEGLDRPADRPERSDLPPVIPPQGSTAPSGTAPTSGTASTSTTDTAKHAATDVAQQAGDSAREVGGVAKEQAKDTAGAAKETAKETVAEVRYQARDLYDQGRQQLTEQASTQQSRLAEGLRSFSGELSSMTRGEQQEGMATDLTRQAADYLERAGRWLDEREPGDVLSEVSRYARRHPGAFMAIAGGLGLLVGRVARGLRDASSDDTAAQGAATSPRSGYSAGYAGGQYDQGTTTYGGGYGAATVEPPVAPGPGPLGTTAAGLGTAGGVGTTTGGLGTATSARPSSPGPEPDDGGLTAGGVGAAASPRPSSPGPEPDDARPSTGAMIEGETAPGGSGWTNRPEDPLAGEGR
ncbi:hypothetical protein MF406_00170 [Georgenia sp. TF02-10]|uniref:hypothetical protein n=1 Tax=Georgenia sp. TF02-10 TaxID=2917725 RepID=UPI001FA73DE3|nr:hypothetical protein [Georgenia sp. TF02-10]UNX54764.1 hypothetical protein MF406_00170 [Georgenia sp. TF02-10]